MSSSTITSAVAKRETGAAAQIKAYQPDFAIVLPRHLDVRTWVRAAQAVLDRNPKLAAAAERNVPSFMAALLDCAQLGLEPGKTYHFLPFGSAIAGVPDYKGIIELMYRAGAVTSVKAEIVYANDTFDYDPGSGQRPIHVPGGRTGQRNWFASQEDRGPMVGAYAYAEMAGGGISQVVVMAEWEIREHKAVSKTANAPDSMWKLWPRAAWKKTVIRELSKWVPTSPEWITHKVRAERAAHEPSGELSAAARALPPPIIDDENPVMDGELASADPHPTPPAPAEPDWDTLITEGEGEGGHSRLREAWELAKAHRPDDQELFARIGAARDRLKAAEAAGLAAPNDTPAMMSGEQRKKLFAILSNGGIRDSGGMRAARIDITNRVLGPQHPTVSSWSELTAADAHILIDTLEELSEGTPLTEVFRDLPGKDQT